MKPKLLCILHSSPAIHGAAIIGESITLSEKVRESYDCRFINIRSSETISEIGSVSLKKFYYVIQLYIKVIWALLIFRPQKIYFTPSIKGVAFYRDLFLSTFLKFYKKVTSAEVFYHYHSKGIDAFVSSSPLNLKLTRFFLKNINLIILSPMLENDFDQVQTYKTISFLPNGVEDTLNDELFKKLIATRYAHQEPLNILYLSNMIKSKGYFSVLELANKTKERSIHYHFAGEWQNNTDKKEFFNYINKYTLENKVTFHGFVRGEKKRILFEKSHFFMFPTRYENEAFSLSLLEAMSYGLPSITTDEGSNPYILDEKSGIILNDITKLPDALDQARQRLLNKETAMYCRQRYLDNFSLEQFENNLVKILSD